MEIEGETVVVPTNSPFYGLVSLAINLSSPMMTSGQTKRRVRIRTEAERKANAKRMREYRKTHPRKDVKKPR